MTLPEHTNPAPTHPAGLPLPALEQAYDTLAQAIDAAGDKSELMLVKLALLLAQRLGDAEAFEQAVGAALLDL